MGTWGRRTGGYAFAAGLTAIAVVLRLVGGYDTSHEPALILFVLPILVSAYVGGLGPGLLATGLAALATNYFFLPPRNSFSLPAGLDSVQWIGLIVVGVVVSALSEDLHRTRQRERERDAQRLEERAALLDLTSDAVLVLSADREQLTFWSAGAQQLYGWTSEQALGHSPHELLQTVWPESAEAVGRQLAQNDRWEGELRHRAADGREIVVLSRQALARDTHGAPTAVLEINTDLTHRIGLEQQLRQAQKLEAIGQLAGGIAHDFNNLLTVVSGFGAGLEERLPPGQDSEDLAEMLRAAERATRLTRQLLAFSRRQNLDVADVDLGAVVAELAPMLRRLIGEDVDVVVHGAPAAPSVLADRAQMEQVLVNLAVNARDAMPGGGTLTIETRAVALDETYVHDHVRVDPGRYVCVSVSDTGTGIPPEALPHLFEPFYTTKDVGQGTGLGLATVHGILAQSGGHVLVYTERDVGTTFKLYLPVSTSTTAPAPAAFPAEPAERLDGTETILLCEDEPPVRRLLERLLTKHGYHVIGAELPTHALELARANGTPIDAAISDVIMPGMSGPELAGQLDALYPGLPILFVSGYTGDILRDRASLPRDSVVVEKPFDRTTLLRSLRRLLDART